MIADGQYIRPVLLLVNTERWSLAGVFYSALADGEDYNLGKIYASLICHIPFPKAPGPESSRPR